MSSSRRVLFLILIMVITSLAATGTSLTLLYQTAFEQTRARLTETASSQARLIDAVARFDRQFSQFDDPGGSLGATISQVKDAHSQYLGIGKTGEIIMAKRDGDKIIFVLHPRHATGDFFDPIDFDSKLAEPMRRALSGHTGSIVDLDYRGEPVLAAYEPVPRLGMGIVAKMDLAEMRAPFVRAGLIASLIALLMIALGTVLFLRIGGKMVRQVAASDRRFRTLLGSSPVCVQEMDLEGRLVAMNEAGLRMMGLTDEAEIIGKDYLSIPAAADQSLVRKHFTRACAGEPCEFFFSVDSSEGRQHISSSFVPIRGENGEVTRLMGISQDITKAKEIESALIRSESRYRDLYDKAEVAIFEEDFSQLWTHFEELRAAGVVDLRAQLESGQVSARSLAKLVVVKHVNRASLDLFGASSEELLLSSIEIILVPTSMKVFTEELCALWQGEDIFRAEADHRTVRGDSLRVIISLPLPQSAEAAHSVPVTMIDVTRQRETEETLRRSQKMDAIGQLAGGIAHDFNNLMAIMMGHSEILGKIIGPDDQAQQSVRALIQSVERGASLTRRLLTFSRQQPYEPTLSDLGALVGELRDLLARTLGETVELTIDADQEVWPTKIDAHQLEHAIINLALNSLDAMPTGGKLSIRASNTTIQRTKAGKFRDVSPGDYIEVEVRDTGSGIPREHIDRVFDPFFTTKEFGQGTGLGLSTVYGFVRQSGGHILLESEPGQGTTFRILLPRYRGDQTVAKPTASAEMSFPGGDERILVVEDDPNVRKIPVAVLTGMGYQVIEAKTGKEAIEILEGPIRFDLLFTDVVLPGGIDGLKIATHARRLQPQIMILYTTGYAKEAILARNSLDERSMTLNKPYHSRDLLRATRSILDRHGTNKA